jgi:hypothetical protein
MFRPSPGAGGGAERLNPYTVVLSAVGEDRSFAASLRDHLERLGRPVDFEEAPQQLVTDAIDSYLGVLYRKGYRWVVPVLGQVHSQSGLPLFSDPRLKARLDSRQLIPIWSVRGATGTSVSNHDLNFDPLGDLDTQARRIAGRLIGMLR